MQGADAPRAETAEAIPAAPVANESSEKTRKDPRAVISNDKLEMVCNTLRIPANLKQFGFMLGLTKQGRARPRSGQVIARFCQFLNSSERVKAAGWTVGEDAMRRCSLGSDGILGARMWLPVEDPRVYSECSRDSLHSLI